MFNTGGAQGYKKGFLLASKYCQLMGEAIGPAT